MISRVASGVGALISSMVFLEFSFWDDAVSSGSMIHTHL
jgi:hypothetical protein